MNDPILLVTVEREDDGAFRVLSPAVGSWSELPHPGALLGPGSRVGRLTRLNKRFALVLPEGIAGRWIDDLPRQRNVAVEYGETLFRLTPVGEQDAAALRSAGHAPAERGGAALADDAHALLAPSDGVFYSRASPEAPPFVDVGATVRRGQTVGLVEVMKTFNQITYDGPGLPDQAEVVEIRVSDAEDVRAGQVLLVLR